MRGSYYCLLIVFKGNNMYIGPYITKSAILNVYQGNLTRKENKQRPTECLNKILRKHVLIA